jgi:hypothetical protein
MRVRLMLKFADRIDDVDLQGCEVGDVLELPEAEARLLVAERWAVPDPDGRQRPRRRRIEDDLEEAS